MKLQKFDALVVRHFLQHWLVVASLMLGMFIGLDIIGHGDEISESSQLYGGIVGSLIGFILLNIPFQLVMFGPYITLLSGMSAVMSMSRTRQWVPVLTAGRSAVRAVAPIFITALGIGLLLAGTREILLPEISTQREAAMRKIYHQRKWEMAGLSARTSDDLRLYAGHFSPNDGSLENLEIYARGSSSSDRVLFAKSASWDGEKWKLDGGIEIETGEIHRQLDFFKHSELGPGDLIDAYFAVVSPLELSAGQLGEILARDPEHRQAETLRWSLRVAPAVHWVLLLLGIPFVLRFSRRSGMDGIAWGLLLAMMFFVADLVFVDLGSRGVLSPFWAGCGASLFFGVWGILRISRTT